jgi:hypothetical protein
MAQVKLRTKPEEQLVYPMKFIMSYGPVTGLNRRIELTLTKPMQVTGSHTKGFSYEVLARTNVRISRLLVNLTDLDKAVTELIAEGNRFYLLYCYPV